MRRGLLGRVNKKLSDMMLMIARASELNVGFNNNMAAIAHFIVNFERMLQLGTTGIIEEIRTMKREKPGNNQDFYDGAIIALRALESFADRYAAQPGGHGREGAGPGPEEGAGGDGGNLHAASPGTRPAPTTRRSRA